MQSTPSELLATVLLGGKATAITAAREIEKRNGWPNAIRLSLNWHALPQLRSRVAALGIGLDDDSRTALANLSAASAAQSALVCHTAARALSALEDSGIRAAAFKGLGMIASVYQSPADRMLSDADVLIESNSFRSAVPVLEKNGFIPDVSIPLNAWLDLLEQRVYPVHDFLDFVHSTGTKIDLHWRLRTPASSGFPISEVLDRAEFKTVSGVRIRTAAPEDAILLTTHHLIRDKLAPRSAVKDLSDLGAWLEIGERLWSADILVARARATGLTISLLAALEILVRFDPKAGAALLAKHVSASSSPDELNTGKRLADVFSLQLQRGTMSDVVVGLTAMTPSLARRFVVSRLRSLTDPAYKAHKFAGDSAVPFHVVAREIFRDLFTLTPRRLVLYRTLAHETRGYLGDETR